MKSKIPLYACDKNEYFILYLFMKEPVEDIQEQFPGQDIDELADGYTDGFVFTAKDSEKRMSICMATKGDDFDAVAIHEIVHVAQHFQEIVGIDDREFEARLIQYLYVEIGKLFRPKGDKS